MARTIGSIVAALSVVACVTACSAAETSEGQTSTESVESGSSSASAVADIDASNVVVLTSNSNVPPWYINGVESSTSGVFIAGICNTDLYYYPLRRQGNPKDAYGYFTPATVRGVGDGILLSMVDDYATNGIEPYGLIVWVSEAAQKVFSIEQVAEFYFIPDAELNIDPEFAKHTSPEIGLCADQNLS